MRAVPLALTGLLAAAQPIAARAQAAPELHLGYDTYAAGLDVARVEAEFALGVHSYRMRLAYHTTGLVGLLMHGHQSTTVDGAWEGYTPEPHEFLGTGEWGGHQRVTEIDYRGGLPIVRALEPPNQKEREPVPPALQAHSMDTLSALALLMRRIAETGRCETTVHTYDGRRATELEAHTVQEEILPHSGRSIYSGPALRCDFEGRMLAGFKFGDDTPADRKPLHGSAWFAAALPGEPPLPVRMQFQTRWFGEAMMFLTDAGPGTLATAERRR